MAPWVTHKHCSAGNKIFIAYKMSCSCCCWGCAACVGADLVGQFKPASAQRGDNKIEVFMTWPRPQRAWAVLRLNAVACLSKTQNAHFYYFALRDLQFSNFPSAENKVTPRHGDPLGLAIHTPTLQLVVHIWLAAILFAYFTHCHGDCCLQGIPDTCRSSCGHVEL